ncbi:hypothetical protein ABG067_003151 [Albugo candida]
MRNTTPTQVMAVSKLKAENSTVLNATDVFKSPKSDLTKLPMEVDSVDDTGKHASAPVENFFVVKWKENDSEESGEDAAFANVSSV